jgi:hypothetical protein
VLAVVKLPATVDAEAMKPFAYAVDEGPSLVATLAVGDSEEIVLLPGEDLFIAAMAEVTCQQSSSLLLKIKR